MVEVVSILIGVIGVLVTIIIFLYKERAPILSAECHPLPNGVPHMIECTVRNAGRKDAKDVFIGFTNMLPAGTRLFAPPDMAAELIPADLLPDPQMAPIEAAVRQALSVRLPRVPAKSSTTFQLATTHSDNERASEQVVRIRKEMVAVLKAFGERLGAHPQEASKWKISDVISAHVKRQLFFSPGYLSYEMGRVSVAFLTADEEVAEAVNQELYSRYKAEFIDIYQGRPEFKAPVVRIETPTGLATYAVFPPYIRTFVRGQVSLKEVREQRAIIVYPPVPDSYE